MVRHLALLAFGQGFLLFELPVSFRDDLLGDVGWGDRSLIDLMVLVKGIVACVRRDVVVDLHTRKSVVVEVLLNLLALFALARIHRALRVFWCVVEVY
jgi:hypothetical protein